MRKADLISGFFWLFFAALIAIKSCRLGLGDLHQPGPGFLFFWLSVALAIMSAVVILGARSRRKTGGSGDAIFRGVNYTKIILVLIAVFLYALLLETLGFFVVTALLFIFLLGVVERKGWRFTILSSLIVTVAAYLIFQTWLQTQLPAGIFTFLRF